TTAAAIATAVTRDHREGPRGRSVVPEGAGSTSVIDLDLLAEGYRPGAFLPLERVLLGQDEPLWGLVAVDREGQRDVRGQGLSGAGDVLGLHAVEGAVDRRQTVDGPALVVLVVEGPRVR